MTPRNFFPSPPHLAPWRKNLFFAALAAMFLILTAGAPLRIQHFSAAAEKEAALRHGYRRQLFAHRGEIVDAAGAPLALSADVYEIRADMQMLAPDAQKRARLHTLIPQLAAVLGVSPDALRDKLSGGGRAVLLAKKLPPAAAFRLREFREKHGLRGLRLDYKSERYYPQREYAASVVGYTDYLDVGRAGVEFVHHSRLRQEDGEKRGVRGRAGGRIDGTLSRPPRDGGAITLSIDSRLQFYAYDALQKAAARHDARAGAAAVMDARSGEIVALASYPGFNPNNIRAGVNEKNHALSDAVEPGSLAKPFIVALALKNGVVDADEMFPADAPRRVGGVLLDDKHIREPVSLAGVLQKSSNIGAAMLAMRIGARPIWELYRRLGFGRKTLRMPGEASGKLRDYRNWRTSELVTHSYGYGFSTTLLQMLAGYSVFATDGLRVSPRLEKSALPPFRERVLDAAIARRVRQMLEGATGADGTAAAAAIDGYRVAGKTGTALKFAPGGGYGSDYRAFFVGIAPASRPRYIAAVMIDEPKKNGVGGGAAAAPVFREIMRRALRLNAVAPDLPPNVPADARADV
ncbi:MAG: peptidoglycan D,D-transpeptidase FtsI family protein [Gammaproteobacteria bacterium]